MHQFKFRDENKEIIIKLETKTTIIFHKGQILLANINRQFFFLNGRINNFVKTIASTTGDTQTVGSHKLAVLFP